MEKYKLLLSLLSGITRSLVWLYKKPWQIQTLEIFKKAENYREKIWKNHLEVFNKFSENAKNTANLISYSGNENLKQIVAKKETEKSQHFFSDRTAF